MKKVKIMLTAITVLAVVGGALAFKAQKFGLPKICSGTALNACPNLASAFRTTTTTTADPAISYFYTQVDDNATNCNGVAICDQQTYLKPE